MTYYLTKIFVSAGLVVLVSEIAKRNMTLGALIASLPIVSVLAFVWLYVETKDAAKVEALSASTLWLVIPSLALFVVLPQLLKMGANFWLALAAGCAVTALCYLAMLMVLRSFGQGV